jgi:hypothetical protein
VRRALRLTVALALALAPAAAGATPEQERAAAYDLALEAYRYAIPAVAMEGLRARQTSVARPDRRANAPVNQLGHARDLANPSVRVIVAPNTDTMYSSAHLDLSAEPMVLRIPEHGDRYLSFQLMDGWTNAFRYLRRPGAYAIVGPRWRGRLPRGVRPVSSHADRLWVLGRTLVDGPADVPAVRRLQARMRLVPLSRLDEPGWRPPATRPPPPRVTEAPLPVGAAFLAAAEAAIARNPPPARDRPVLERIAAIGVGPLADPGLALTDAQEEGIAAALADAPRLIDEQWLAGIQAGVARDGGWYTPPANLGAYGTDYATRALIAIRGLGANRPSEAVYPTAVTDGDGALLDGRNRYTLRFAPGQLPPAAAFWSMSMYDAEMFLVANPIDRYAIGDRTPGLRHGPDGSLRIVVSHERPPGGAANWLPAPAGPFRLMLRIYRPEPAALSGRWRPPPLTRSTPAPAPPAPATSPSGSSVRTAG